ncbi:MAG: integrase arm-type DNA-binding domain-containing protein [Burkholderiaceae bacterium]
MGIHKLSARAVHTAGEGDYNDGNGLWLRVADGRGAWVFRYTSPSGKRREMGLGKLARNTLAAAGQSLTRARDEAADARRLLREGIDPLDRRNEQREQARRALQVQAVETKNGRVTLARMARDYHSRVIEPSRSEKHAFEWLRSLENHVPDELWHALVADIQAPALLDALIVLQGKVPETAARIRQRLEAIFDGAEFRGLPGAIIISVVDSNLGAPARDDERDCIGLLSCHGGPWKKVARRASGWRCPRARIGARWRSSGTAAASRCCTPTAPGSRRAWRSPGHLSPKRPDKSASVRNNPDRRRQCITSPIPRGRHTIIATTNNPCPID